MRGRVILSIYRYQWHTVALTTPTPMTYSTCTHSIPDIYSLHQHQWHTLPLHQYQWHISLHQYQWHIFSIQIPMTHTLYTDTNDTPYTDTNDTYSLHQYQWHILSNRYEWHILSIQIPMIHTLYTDTNDTCSLHQYQWYILSIPIPMTHTLYTNTDDTYSLYRYQWHMTHTLYTNTNDIYSLTDMNDTYSLYRYQWHILSIPGTLLITHAPNDTLPIAIPMQPGIGNTWYWLRSMWQCQSYREPHYTELSRLMPKQCRVPLHWAKCQSCSVIPLLQTINLQY